MSTAPATPPLPEPSAPSVLAPVWRRFAAGIYDLLIVLALWFATGAAALALTRGALAASNPLFRAALVLVALGYFALSWQRGGQSIGARAWRLRVEDRSGQSIGRGRSWVRALVMCLGALPLGLGTAWAGFDRERRGLQDHAAGTRVVNVAR